jgi:hypothetical protein
VFSYSRFTGKRRDSRKSRKKLRQEWVHLKKVSEEELQTEKL